jgi:hypothetical protein
LSGRACGAPKGRDGAVEAIRALMVAKRSARSERTQTINQARALLVTGPDDIRVTTFRIAVTRWLNQHGDPDLPATIDQTLAAMRHLTNTPST